MGTLEKGVVFTLKNGEDMGKTMGKHMGMEVVEWDNDEKWGSKHEKRGFHQDMFVKNADFSIKDGEHTEI